MLSPDHRDQARLGNGLILGDQGGAEGEGGGNNEPIVQIGQACGGLDLQHNGDGERGKLIAVRLFQGSNDLANLQGSAALLDHPEQFGDDNRRHDDLVGAGCRAVKDSLGCAT